MVAFTTFVFYKYDDPVQSRGLVGIHAMSVIGLSLLTGYGTMWCIGVPMTTVAIMIPFVVVGVGLDDTFIITGAYFRKLREFHQAQLEQQQQQRHKKKNIKGSIEWDDHISLREDPEETTQQNVRQQQNDEVVGSVPGAMVP